MMIIGKKKIYMGARILWVMALLLILLVLVGGPGVHMGLWSPLDGFMLSMRGAFMGGAALAILSLIVIIIIAMNKKRGGMGKAILTLLIGLVLASPVGYLRMSGGGGIAPIHDITTDMVNPPVFITLVGKRGADANSLDYAGEELTVQQRQSYPNIMPLVVLEDTEQAFTKALEVARNMGWKITGVDATALRFEATDYSLWFAFADDVVVTIKPNDTGSQIDLRSVSRVGISDLGVNAKRIMSFMKNFATSSSK